MGCIVSNLFWIFIKKKLYLQAPKGSRTRKGCMPLKLSCAPLLIIILRTTYDVALDGLYTSLCRTYIYRLFPGLSVYILPALQKVD